MLMNLALRGIFKVAKRYIEREEMRHKNFSQKYRCCKNGQTAFEYLILLAVVLSIVLIGFNRYLPRTRGAANIFFDKTYNGIVGNPPGTLQ
jgi:hypothetical protein